MSSNLTGQFIANTFQNLLQIDSGNTPNSTTILNGIGQVATKVTIDSNSDGNGGLFIKDGQAAGRVMGIQYVNSSGGDAGLNFWTPGSINANLFLRRTGTAWIGYNDGSSVVIPNDIGVNENEFNLYVKKGIQVGYATPHLFNGRINIAGEDPLPQDYGLFINNVHPFIIHRYRDEEFNMGDEQNKTLTINGNAVSANEFAAMVVGVGFNQKSNGKNMQDWICRCFVDNGIWKLKYKFELAGVGADEVELIVDILYIKKGLYIDARGTFIPI